jgi:hypothetical protein
MVGSAGAAARRVARTAPAQLGERLRSRAP